jgi:16S rRNA (cytidine1402-2'-O)-methyltransferase
LAVLTQVNVICCEDTRATRTLLARYGIETPLLAVHEHNEAERAGAVVARLQAGEAVAIVTDAGTPLVSDPGARLVRAAIAAGVRVVPIPGATAAVTAAVAAGFDTHPLTIYGFLSRRGQERDRELEWVLAQPHAVALFESPHRLVETLRDLERLALRPRTVAVGRELTKLYEEVQRGTLGEVAAYYEAHPPRGEIVVVVRGEAPPAASDDALRATVAELRLTGARSRDIVQRLVEAHGASRNLAYRLAHER